MGKKCTHHKGRHQWCRYCSRFSISVNLNAKGKELNNGYNIKEYSLLGNNGHSNSQAIKYLLDHVNKHKAHLMPYANNYFIRVVSTDAVIDSKDLSGKSKSIMNSLSRKLTQH